jgi:hypothetical protein
MRFRVLILVSLLSSSVALSQRKLTQKDLISLRERMTGFFTSESQSLKDSANYFNIHLHMVPIWQGKPGGYWLYVEQATASSLDKPYRQRIYRLSLFNDSTISSQVYEINDPFRFAGAWKNTMMLKNFTEDSLIARAGCAILLHRNENGDFTGSTPGKDCKSSLRGAAYATSEAMIYRNKLVTWDRGWSADDKQVWGATLGGYEFIRQSSYQ